MSGWESLFAEFDEWEAMGRTATLWWRDDDAVTATPALERLLHIGRRAETPVALAVIPRDADEKLRRHLDGFRGATVIQHGWGHDNHAPEGAPWEEHGQHRPREVVLGELLDGRHRILSFARGLPAYVPPWNTIGADLPERLREVGLGGLSGWASCARPDPLPGLHQANVHVDIMDWGEGRFLGVEGVIRQLLDHLSARRQGTALAAEATGLMTHHTWHDKACFEFLDELFVRTRTHAAVRWLDAREAFWPPVSRPH